jgi:DNA modification methylase
MDTKKLTTQVTEPRAANRGARLGGRKKRECRMTAIKKRVQIGNAELLLGDCLEILPEIEAGTVDAIITDPPYGISDTHAGHLSKITLRNGEPAGQTLGFDGITGRQLVELAATWISLANRWCVFTCEWKHIHLLDELGYLVRFGIWRKPDGAPQFTGDRPGMGWEAVAICHRPGQKRWNGGGRHAFWSIPKSGDSGHPTGKPVALYESFVSLFTDEGEMVLDPFMGRATTGVACLRLGRRFIGIEKDETHFNAACQRIAAEVAQGDLFRKEEGA